jgi:hypothetical protein
VADDAHLAARRVEQAGQHLERGGLAGAVGAEEADPLARLDGERQLLDRAHRLVFTAKERAQRGAHARLALVHPVVFGEAAELDVRHVNLMTI